MNTRISLMLITSILASALMIVNGALIATNGRPLVLTISSLQVNASASNATKQVVNATNFWGRVVLGMPGLTGDWQTPFWLLFAIAILICVVLVYRKPATHRKYSPFIGIFSLMTLPIGGGFFLGSILGLIGAMVGYEWPKPFKETFLGKIVKAATLDSKLYAAIGQNANAIGGAALTVILIGLLSGIGNGLYAYNVDLIKGGDPAAHEILFDGQVFWDTTVILTTISLIGMALVKWLILSSLVYWIGARTTGIPCSYDKIARMVAFAYVPEGLMIFLPAMFSNFPALTFDWPVGLYIISRLWLFISLIIILTQALELSKMRALGVAVFGGAIYWLAYYMFIVPTLNVPGVRIELAMPESSVAMLAAFGIAAIVSAMLGLFSRKQSM